MDNMAKRYPIIGIVFLIIGIRLLITGAVSRVMAYGDFIIAFVFFNMSARANKHSDDDKKSK